MRVILICLLFVIGFNVPVLAKDRIRLGDNPYTQNIDELRRINNYRPEQSSRHTKAKKILGSRVLDSTNRVVGEVNNLILDRSGSINMLDVDFNRMRLDVESLMIGYGPMRIRPATNGYKIGQTDDEVKAMLPELLNNMETASGNQSNSLSLKKLLGADLYNQYGDRIARIEDVLFSSTGSRAELLYIQMKEKSVRGEKFAIPFSQIRIKGKRLSVSDKFADTMIHYGKLN